MKTTVYLFIRTLMALSPLFAGFWLLSGADAAASFGFWQLVAADMLFFGWLLLITVPCAIEG